MRQRLLAVLVLSGISILGLIAARVFGPEVPVRTPVDVSPAEDARLRITEVAPFVAGDRPAFIEIRNLSDEAIDVAGFVVQTGPETGFTFAEGGPLIQPQGHLVLWLDDRGIGTPVEGGLPATVHGPRDLSDPWSPSSGQAMLTSPEGASLSGVVWGAPVAADQSIPDTDALWQRSRFVHLHDSFGLYEMGTPVPNGASVGLYPNSPTDLPEDWSVFDASLVSPGEINPVPQPGTFTTPDGARVDAASLSIAWRGRRGDRSYRYQLANSASFSPATIVEQGVVDLPYYVPRFRLRPGPYFFRVHAAPSFHDLERGAARYGRALRFFATSTSSSLTSVVLKMDHLVQRKDSPLLCLEGCAQEGGTAGGKSWRSAHPNAPPAAGDHGHEYCARASVAMVVSNYGKMLSQDRIAMYTAEDLCTLSPVPDGCLDQCWDPILNAPEGDLAHNTPVYCEDNGVDCDPVTWTLQWALGTAVEFVGCENVDAASTTDRCNNIDVSDIKGWIDAGRPIVARLDLPHFVAINGYRVTAGATEVLIHDPMEPVPGWHGFNSAEYKGFWLGPKTASGALSTLGWWHADTDGDGIVDFDETYRFPTHPKDGDTDDDGVTDLHDIRGYVFTHTGAWAAGKTFTATCGSLNVSFSLSPDTDGDGLRKEVDVDNDGDGCPDGAEDTNGNGVHERGLGESSNFVHCDCQLRVQIAGCQCR